MHMKIWKISRLTLLLNYNEVMFSVRDYVVHEEREVMAAKGLEFDEDAFILD